ncbi:MAG: FecR family protein [Sulfurimonas sp.]|jgi:hypothetical protein
MKTFNKIILSLMLLNSVVLANSVATITSLQGSASIIHEAKSVQATLGATLSEKDTLKTEDKSKVQLIFNDETIITIGKNSNFSINEYLYDDNKAPSAKFGLLNGAMRTITGKIGKIAPDKFSVQTRTTTIGIRGTNFTVLVQPNGVNMVYCTLGEISVSINHQLSTVTQGFYMGISPDGKRSDPIKFTPKQLNDMRNESFTKTEEEEKESKASEETTKKAADSKSKEDSGAITSADNESPIDTTRAENIHMEARDIAAQTTNMLQSVAFGAAENITAPDKEADATTDYYTYFSGITSDIDFTHYANHYYYGSATVVNNISIPGYIIGNMVVLSSGEFNDINNPVSFEFYGALAGQATNNFNVKFTGVYGSNYDINTDSLTSDKVKANLIQDSTSNYMRTTQDDLSANDSMIWGKWSTHAAYIDANGETIENIRNGLWMAGEPTPNAIIESYHTSNMVAHYDGIYKAYSDNSTSLPKSESGHSDMFVDFGAGTASLNIYLPTANTTVWEHYNMSANANNISGSGTNNVGSHSDGQFYGADAKSVGGNFTIYNGAAPVTKGVYEVTTTAIIPK